MMFNVMALLVYLALAVFLTVLPLGNNYAFSRERISQGSQEQQIMDFSLSGFGEKGKKSWDISGKSADMSSSIIQLESIVSNLYGEKENVKLTAQRGSFDKNEGKLHLEQDVVIATSSGAKLTTDSLDWDRKNQVVATLDKVNIERDNMVTVAQGVTGYPNLNKINLEKQVQVEINQTSSLAADSSNKEKNKIIITCDGPLEIDYSKSVGVFRNNVKVLTQDSVINSDIMEVYFVKEEVEAKDKSVSSSSTLGANNIDKIIARGNVRITRGDNVSYSEEATYLAKDQKIILTGKPKLVIYSTEDLKNASSGN